ncbi:phytase [Micromonospora rubida]|uniref:phytase n=1 Tax=Micromonospora rubida TaxID=2697657 RepID=UPI001378B68F|nr:phytase [Micromonospora rubida]NBE83317.1 phytase [Micromonospora rubida]
MRFKPDRRLLTAASFCLTAVVVVASTSTPAAAMAVPTIKAELETPTLFDDTAGGNANADDPAIWVHPTNSAKSLVVGTAKEGGLRVYNLSGGLVQSIAAPAAPGPDDEPGRFNNVDLLYGVRVGGATVDLAVTTDRGRDTLRVYRINPAGGSTALTDVTSAAAPLVFSANAGEVNDGRTAYGLATWKDRATGRNYALVSQRHETSVALLELTVTPAGTVTYHKVRSLTLPQSFALPNGTTWTPCDDPGDLPQVEGMVVDATSGVLYAGQEDVGIWKVSATLTGTPVLMDKVKEFGLPLAYDPVTEECYQSGPDPGYGGTHITADVEGLTIYYRANGKGYLLASSQGDNSFVVYQRFGANTFLGSFRVGPHSDPAHPDGSEECDGAMVMNVPLGDRFDEGLFVVQDGFDGPEVLDGNGEPRTTTNFKFVEWDDIAEDLDLAVDPTGWSPRS